LSDEPYPIDLDKPRAGHSARHRSAALLLDFAAWLEGRPGSGRLFQPVGNFTDLRPVVDGSPLRDQFALFMRLPEGSVVGAWYGIGGAPANAPTVALAPEGHTNHGVPRSTDCSRKSPCSDLRRWRMDRISRRIKMSTMQRMSLPSMAGGTSRRQEFGETGRAAGRLPDFGRLDGKWCSDRGDLGGHPMTDRTRETPDGTSAGRQQNPGGTTHFDVAIVGCSIKCGSCAAAATRRRGEAIEPLLRDLRDERWRAPKQSRALVFDVACDVGQWPHLPRFDYGNRPMIGRRAGRHCRGAADLRRHRGRNDGCRPGSAPIMRDVHESSDAYV